MSERDFNVGDLLTFTPHFTERCKIRSEPHTPDIFDPKHVTSVLFLGFANDAETTLRCLVIFKHHAIISHILDMYFIQKQWLRQRSTTL